MTFTDQEISEIRQTLNERKTVLEESRLALERPEFRSLFLSAESSNDLKKESSDPFSSIALRDPEELLRSTLLSLARQLEDVLAAQSRLASGRFGVCERCGHPMPHSLVRDLPEARLCLKCSL